MLHIESNFKDIHTLTMLVNFVEGLILKITEAVRLILQTAPA